jgi:polyisoprenoid-binding protein YceI
VKRTLAFAFAAVFAASPAFAAHWTVDYSKSRLGFTLDWNKAPATATFKSWKAAIDFDPGDLAHARVDVTIALASEFSDGGDLDDTLKGDQGFSVAQFATAHFVTIGFSHTSGNSYVAMGTLSLHGVSRPVTLPFTLVIAGKTAHMTGTASLLRTDFELGQAGADPVAPQVTVNVDLTATEN